MIDKGNYYQWYEKGHYESETRAWKDIAVSGTLTTSDKTKIECGGGKSLMNNLRIRKLTPRECGRLMGVKDEDIDKMMRNQSNASCYHLAGDSIVTLCLMAIIGNMCGKNYKNYFKPDEWWKNN